MFFRFYPQKTLMLRPKDEKSQVKNIQGPKAFVAILEDFLRINFVCLTSFWLKALGENLRWALLREDYIKLFLFLLLWEPLVCFRIQTPWSLWGHSLCILGWRPTLLLRDLYISEPSRGRPKEKREPPAAFGRNFVGRSPPKANELRSSGILVRRLGVFSRNFLSLFAYNRIRTCVVEFSSKRLMRPLRSATLPYMLTENIALKQQPGQDGTRTKGPRGAPPATAGFDRLPKKERALGRNSVPPPKVSSQVRVKGRSPHPQSLD